MKVFFRRKNGFLGKRKASFHNVKEPIIKVTILSKCQSRVLGVACFLSVGKFYFAGALFTANGIAVVLLSLCSFA